MLSASWKCYLLNNEIKCKYTLEKDKTGTEPTVFLLRGEQMERTECRMLFLQDAEMGRGSRQPPLTYRAPRGPDT